MKWNKAKNQLLQNPAIKVAYEKTDITYAIAKMIIDARIVTKMTQEALAEKLGTKQPSIARLESGNSLPSLSYLQKVADAFGTELIPPKLAMLEKTATPSIQIVLNLTQTGSYTHNTIVRPAKQHYTGGIRQITPTNLPIYERELNYA